MTILIGQETRAPLILRDVKTSLYSGEFPNQTQKAKYQQTWTKCMHPATLAEYHWPKGH